MAMTPEGRVKHAVKQELKRRDIWYFMPVSNGMGQVGIPDFICCWEGKFLAIETKAPGKKGQTTANQDRIIAKIKDHWGMAIVVDDVSQLVEFLNERTPHE